MHIDGWLWVMTIVMTLLLLVGSGPFGVTSARNLRKFAERGGFRVTTDNGQVLLEYLATMARWRFAGVLIAWVVDYLYFEWPRVGDGSDQILLRPDVMLLGFVAGMAVGEARFTAFEAFGAPSSASLHRRRAVDYFPERLLWLVGALWTGLVVCAGYAMIRMSALPGEVDFAPTYRLFAGVVIAAGAAAYTVRAIVSRPQPAMADDVIAADEAIRSESLRLLACWSIAYAGCVAVALLEVIDRRVLNIDYHVREGIEIGVLIAAPLLAVICLLTCYQKRTAPAERVLARR